MQAQELLVALADGGMVSGAQLAERAGVTRAAIWKQIEALRARGVPVESRGTAGYCLPWPVQLLDLPALKATVPAAVHKRLGTLELHWEVDSTSSEIQRRQGDLPDLSMVLAETQSAGRGRRGRRWLSPPGLNVYLSCLKRFDAGFAALSGLSLAVGVIVMRTLASLGIDGAGLKWPNDVLSDNGKLAGILVELGGEYQGPCAAIIGVGLNVRLTEALHEQAGQPVNDLTTLAGAAPDRNRVAAALITALAEGLDQFEREGFAAFVDEYARHDLLRDKALRVQGAIGALEGIGAGVDERGALLLQAGDGLHRIDSADVTVRRA
ncbi:BirA family transcriptional regulator, biotin operon repressor / biotin-[acetyl-CoA-carboxylase] ligase [Dyella jiangningensis]|uniref:biotin--[acetyl-CoA-carboxylase] ligase n=1 Tax=Dyella sp. AtDHG13 TaxID=1938897 RepID=UPI0008826D4E|nr:biotin--[acetyl-CoA-carboxylase] ligase [Dyella sp. AtDHG13]PXV57318.1 BirA family biotin operon repressor/biotin-[acetyl-CoA-carboxylase] ligase [Dyella sp. AtDHG13]SDK39820.1 BirA family transcriptional regulator, biotin operon repressor / biotin-[acetyl-CoA-carboxylase] ligase [Dyella jiangningensis]